MGVSLVALLALASSVVNDDLDRYIYPLSSSKESPEIVLDYSDAPELKEWMEKARDLAKAWYPRICELLSTEDFTAPEQIKFTVKKGIDPPAYATRNEIVFKAEWLTARPDDMGIVIHELVHIIQAYPRNRHNTGWLVEGIADYVRWWRYEPEAPRSRINFETASYRDAYRTTAAFLAWAVHKYDKRLVPALDLALRKAEDPGPVFVEVTGKSVDDLWEEFKTASAR